MRNTQPDWLTANRAMWDEAVPLHATSELYDLETFARGRDALLPYEGDELGSVVDLDLLHVQCHIGTDTLTWARRGARVVGLDFSEPALDVARGLAAGCGLDAEFVCANVYDAVDSLGGRQFDVVYTGMGALVWLPDVTRWAQVVHELVAPGGVLYLVEIHPLVIALDEGDGRSIANDLLDTEYTAYDEPGGTYAAPDAVLEHTLTYERNPGIGEVVTALIDAGLRIEFLHEHGVTNAPLPWLDHNGDGTRRVPAGRPRLPLTYSLRARRQA